MGAKANSQIDVNCIRHCSSYIDLTVMVLCVSTFFPFFFKIQFISYLMEYNYVLPIDLQYNIQCLYISILLLIPFSLSTFILFPQP